MKKVLYLIVLSLFVKGTHAQLTKANHLDYKIYSLIIEDMFQEHDSNKLYVDNAVVVNQLKTKENFLDDADLTFDYDYSFQKPIDKSIWFTFRKDSSFIKECKKMLFQLKDLSSRNPILEIDSFVRVPVLFLKR